MDLSLSFLYDSSLCGAASWTSLFCDYKTWARVLDVLDGDTVCLVFPSFHGIAHPVKFNVRLAGIDTAELKDKNQNVHTIAVQARTRLLELITGNVPAPPLSSRRDIQRLLEQNPALVFAHCKELDKYGRVLADIFLTDKDVKSLNSVLVDEGLALPYMGGTKAASSAFLSR